MMTREDFDKKLQQVDIIEGVGVGYDCEQVDNLTDELHDAHEEQIKTLKNSTINGIYIKINGVLKRLDTQENLLFDYIMEEWVYRLGDNYVIADASIINNCCKETTIQKDK